MIRTLQERCLEHDQDVYVCYVDFEKAFDRVNWEILMETLKNIGVDWKDRRMIRNLYIQQRATVRVAEGESELVESGRGVRQGCLLSPLLFSIYVEAMMIEAMEDIDEGVKVGGKLLKYIRFADDEAMVADSEKGLQEILDKLVEVGRKYDMKINVKKTKTMRMSRRDGLVVNIVIEGQNVEQLTKFRYLGATIADDDRCDVEIKTRIGMAKDAFNKEESY